MLHNLKAGKAKNQEEKRLYLIRYLLNEQPKYRGIEIPADESAQKQLLRSLFNIRMPQVLVKNLSMFRMNICKRKFGEKALR